MVRIVIVLRQLWRKVYPVVQKNCSGCVIDGREYAVGQIIEEIPCKKVCICNKDHIKECTDLTEDCTTKKCPPGFKPVESNDVEQGCCKCVPDNCAVVKEYKRLRFNTTSGNVCTSTQYEVLTSCKGECPSMEGPGVLLSNGENTYDKSCKCCAGVKAFDRNVQVTCDDDTEMIVKMEVYDRCICEVCVENHMVQLPAL